jgi:5-methylcytosine-specific restriction endonuclease McrA
VSLSHLSDGTLRRELDALVGFDCRTTAKLLTRIAEFERRRLYAEDGYSSMFTFCVQKLHFSEDMAFKRIRVARAVRRFPALLDAIADGRLHLTGAVFLAPHLRSDNYKELIEAAAHKTKAEVELLIAQRFPRPDLASLVRAVPTPVPPAAPEVVPEPVRESRTQAEVVPEPVRESTIETEVVPEPPRTIPTSSRVTPLAPRRFAFQTTIGQITNDKLQAIQELLGPRVHPRDLEQILDRAFDALLEKLQRGKCGAADRPRQTPLKPSTDPRHVPAHVRRAVWSRDEGRCTFVSATGHRCAERKSLEYDHVVEVARGGQASVEGMRLLCRAHNQLSAERAFGSEFMRTRREAAKLARGT